MKFKELLTVLDSKAYMNIISDKGRQLYEGRVFITSDLHERRVKLVDIIRNEFLLQWRINK